MKLKLKPGVHPDDVNIRVAMDILVRRASLLACYKRCECDEVSLTRHPCHSDLLDPNEATAWHDAELDAMGVAIV